MNNYTILYKCDCCNRTSQKLEIYCYYCGTKLINKGALKNEKNTNRTQGRSTHGI